MNKVMLALELMDLTSLNDNDTEQSIINLCQQAKTPYGHPAAICIYPQFVPAARKVLYNLGLDAVKIATVTNFPQGSASVEQARQETSAAIALGADEVDVVFPYQAFMNGFLNRTVHGIITLLIPKQGIL